MLPVVAGGDHSINAPCIQAFDDQGPIHIIQIDAHLDFVDERHGVRFGHGNPIRRASEKGYVTGMTQLGIRNVSSSNREDHKKAESVGSTILSVRDVRRLGPEGVLALIPDGVNYYITIDIDGFDPQSPQALAHQAMGALLTMRLWKYYRVWLIKVTLSVSIFVK